MKHKDELVQAVIDLHYIARLVERNMGVGTLSENIRECAERLNSIVEDKYDFQQDKGTEGTGS